MTASRPHWTPAQLDNTGRLAARLKADPEYGLDQQAVDEIIATAGRILGRGPASPAEDSVTGLALGYVQSGKTMSFTALAALAADNGYSVIVALLGSTRLLTGQNSTRLEADLGIDDASDYRWHPMPVPTAGEASPDQLAGKVSRHLRRGRAVLLTTLKNSNRISVAADILRSAQLAGHRALVIDDEADQISLNARVADAEQSATYAAILSLRQSLPSHLYVQYTATPYAPLLIDASDELHPEFVEFLEPGEGYTGGRTFLFDERGRVVRPVDSLEAEDFEPESVPPRLRRALADFVVGSALAELAGDRRGPLSMLIHVSHLTGTHQHWERMVRPLVDSWRRRAQRDASDPGRADLMREFQASYDDLMASGAPPADSEDWQDAVEDALTDLEIHVVNSVSGLNEIPWRQSPLHLLIGGNKLDRGFTVRGLTVSYLTRRITGSNVDTVEQRARFFGYKRSLIPYCRVYAPQDVLDSLRQIVHTEEDLRERLAEWQEDERPLRDFAESVGILVPAHLSATRRTVVSNPQVFRLARWHTLLRPSREVGDVTANSDLVEGLGIESASAIAFGTNQQHRHVALDIREVRDLLDRWRVEEVPGWPQSKLISGLERLEGLSVDKADVLLLSGPGDGPRRRSWDRVNDRIPNLMQGRDNATGYPGDRFLDPSPGEERPQLQIHYLLVDSQRLHSLALHVPPGLLPGDIVTRGS